MTAFARVEEEIARLNEVLRRRGIFYEDEQGRMTAMMDVRQWMREDRGTVKGCKVEPQLPPEDRSRVISVEDLPKFVPIKNKFKEEVGVR